MKHIHPEAKDRSGNKLGKDRVRNFVQRSKGTLESGGIQPWESDFVEDVIDKKTEEKEEGGALASAFPKLAESFVEQGDKEL